MYTPNKDDIYKAAIGAEVVAASAGGDRAEVVLADGRTLALTLDGECCSSSYFTPDADAQIRDMVGAKIQGVEERDGESRVGLDEEWAKKDESRGDTVSWHFLVFITDKGHFTVDWRNDSNGYYDGSVHPSISGPAATA